MPSSKAVTSPTYTIFIDGRIRQGDPRELFSEIYSEVAGRSPEIAKMGADRYASAIIDDASSVLPKPLFKFLEAQEYESDYERALRYLAEMPTSGVRVLDRK